MADLVSTWPPPPPFYESFPTDPSADSSQFPEPPPTPGDDAKTFELFGQTYQIELDLPQLSEQGRTELLPDEPDAIKALRIMNKAARKEFANLLATIARNEPSTAHLKTLELLFINMHWRLQCLRPVQADCDVNIAIEKISEAETEAVATLEKAVEEAKKSMHQ